MSIGTEYKEITKYSRENKILYAKKHGYYFIEDESIYIEGAKEIPWYKILLILKYLDKYDYIVWMDADLLVMNNEIKLEDIIEKYSNYSIICGNCPRMINTGMLFVKNNDFSKQFLMDVFNNVYDPASDPSERYYNYEQGSFINLWDKNHLESKIYIKITNPREMNSYWYNYHYGDFILHGAGIRGEMLKYFLNRFMPDKMDFDTDESYISRIKYLKEDFRKEHDLLLKSW